MLTRKELADATFARLQTLGGPSGYRGRVPLTPPTIGTEDLRVLPYWVLWAGTAGAPEDERSSGDRGGNAWSFQVTAAAGAEEYLPQLIDDIVTLLSGWRPDSSTGRCWPPLGYDPGQPRTDDSKTPPRYYVPLLFTIHA